MARGGGGGMAAEAWSAIAGAWPMWSGGTVLRPTEGDVMAVTRGRLTLSATAPKLVHLEDESTLS